MSGSAENEKDAELARLRLKVSELTQHVCWLENVNADQLGRIDGLLNRVAFMLRKEEEAEQGPASHRRRHLRIVPAAIGFLLIPWRRLGTVARGAVAASTVAAIGAGTASILLIQPGTGAPAGAPSLTQPRQPVAAPYVPTRRRRASGPAKPRRVKLARKGTGEPDADDQAQVQAATPGPTPTITVPAEPVPSVSPTVPPGGGPTPTPTPQPSPGKHKKPKHPHGCLNLILLNLCHG